MFRWGSPWLWGGNEKYSDSTTATAAASEQTLHLFIDPRAETHTDVSDPVQKAMFKSPS